MKRSLKKICALIMALTVCFTLAIPSFAVVYSPADTGDSVIYDPDDPGPMPGPLSSTVTVRFNSQGGSTVSSQEVDMGSTPWEPNDPYKSGATFSGWYLDKNGYNRYDFRNDSLFSDTTLYACWTVDKPNPDQYYTVTFNANGGYPIPATQTVFSRDILGEPENPSKNGYTFTGWYSDSKCTNKWNFYSNTVTKNMTLYAGWSKSRSSKYTVSFVVNGGTPAPKSQSVEWGAYAVEPRQPSRSGYLFSGWYCNSSLTNRWEFDRDYVTGATTLYAKWTKSSNSYSAVNFVTYGGTPAPAIQKVAYNGYAVEPVNPTKTGYVFAGWYMDKYFTHRWDFYEDTVTGPTTLYALWIAGTVSNGYPVVLGPFHSAKASNIYYESLVDGKASGYLTTSDKNNITADHKLGVTTDSRVTGTVKATFDSNYSNKLRVVTLTQKGNFGFPVTVSAIVDLTGMNTSNLFLYSYNRDTGSLQQLSSPTAWLDNSGYLNFSTTVGGDIIISNGILVKK